MPETASSNTVQVHVTLVWKLNKKVNIQGASGQMLD